MEHEGQSLLYEDLLSLHCPPSPFPSPLYCSVASLFVDYSFLSGADPGLTPLLELLARPHQ